MALFRRTKKESVLPEVDKYYEGERRDRTGLAWLLALVSVVVVALVLVGAFLGGRWLYRQITKDDNNQVATTQNDDSTDAPSFDGSSQDSQDSNNDNDDQNEEDESTDDQDESSEGNVDAPARTDTPSTPAETPRTGDDPLPSTGPADLVGIFTVVAAVAGGTHYVIERRKAVR